MNRGMNLKRPLLRVLSLFLITAGLGFSQRKAPAIYSGPQTQQVQTMPPSRSVSLQTPPSIDLGRLSASERAQLQAVGMKQRIGVHRTLPDGALDRGLWTTLPDGRSIWRLAIQSEGSTGLRIQFSNFSVGTGNVWVHSGLSVDGPYTAKGSYGNGEFWSGTVTGPLAVIEYESDGTITAGRPPFHVHRVAHQELPAARGWLLDTPLPDYAASCEQDVNCFPDWQPYKRSVAQIQFEETQGPEQGTFLCSGSLVSTRDNSFKPYLLTAGHCIHDEDAARSLETFWAYESLGCNLGSPTSRGTLNSQNGGDLLAWNTIENGDYSLVLLPDVPTGVVFAGWDPADPALGSPVVGIHHPEGSYKRISFGNTIQSQTVVVGSDPAPAPLYHDVGWTLGITEPGSSGSPMFSGPGIVSGMLTYGPDAPGEELCTVGDIAGYAKFSNAYLYLQAYLEDFPFSIVQPSPSTLNFTGLNHAITGSAAQTVTLNVATSSSVAWSARGDSPWIQVSPASGTVSATSPVTFQVTVNPQYFLQSDTYTSTVTILSGAAPPQFVNVSVNMVIQTSNIVVSATPNPVPNNNGTWQLTLQLQETNGAATSLTQMKIDGVDYTSSIPAFFGTSAIPANGSISATVHTTGLVAPVTKYFEFFGTDVASGQTWYRLLAVTFNP
jgi:lysyl endopeptidase